LSGAGLQADDAIDVAAAAGDEDDGDGALPAEEPQEADSVHRRQRDVEKDHGRRRLADGLQRRLGAGGGQDLIAGVLQPALNDADEVLLVFDDQDPARGALARRACGGAGRAIRHGLTW
jgi:hypothetical protein